MAKKNWYIAAQQSQDPRVKGLMELYNLVDMNQPDAETKKKDIAEQVKTLLGLGTIPVPEPEPTSEPETPTETETEPTDETPDATEPESDMTEPESDFEPKNAQSEPETPTEPETIREFNYTESEIIKMKDPADLDKFRQKARLEIKRLENTRLKHATYRQNLELDKQIWAVRRLIGLSLKRTAGLKERENRIKKIGRVNDLALKRARFVKLLRQGYSITNITKHPEGVAKEDLTKVLNDATIEDCRKIYSRFPETWTGWKAKFLDKQDEKK